MPNPNVATNSNKPQARPGAGGVGTGTTAGANTNLAATGTNPTGPQAMMARAEGLMNRSGSGIHQVRTGLTEILPQLASRMNTAPEDLYFIGRLQAEARSLGMSVSAFLDEIDPSDQYTGAMASMDAYQRLLFLSGIRTASVPDKGAYADNIGRFFQSNIPGSQVLFPEFINRTMRQSMIAPDILQYIIAVTTGIQGSLYRTIHTVDQASDRRMNRVAQGTDLPKTFLKAAENSLTLYKYGRMLSGSYEYFRTVSIDLFSILLQRIALQSNLDKATAAIGVAVDGDGNANAAQNYNQSTDLDTGTAMTYRGFLRFAMKFYPYMLTTLVGNEVTLVNFLSMARPSVDPFQVLSLLQQNYVVEQRVALPQQIYTNIQLVLLPDLPDGLAVGLDKRYGLEYVVEDGANLVESDRLIQSQRNEIAVSESVGFGKIFNEATKTWTWNA